MKILVLRFSSIGDIVLTTAVVRCLKRQIPGAQIHYLTKKSFENILYNNENVDELITFEKKTDEVLARVKNTIVLSIYTTTFAHLN
jgi:ADP-heptose:LPS heptosyltransferase